MHKWIKAFPSITALQPVEEYQIHIWPINFSISFLFALSVLIFS